MNDGVGAPIEYWSVSPALAPYVTSVHRYAADMPVGTELHDALFPSWPTIRVVVAGEPWGLRIGARFHDPMPTAAFIGPTSNAGYVRATRGVLVGIGLLPMGWARLFGGDVSHYANRAVPLDQVDRGAPALCAALGEGDSPLAVCEAWLTERLDRTCPVDPRIAQLYDLIHDPSVARTEEIAAALEMTPRALAGFTRRHFGFTPKLLVRRSRFVRALSLVLSAPGDSAEVLGQAGYWDRSHFLRDSHLFLGCSIREFNRRRGPLNAMAMAARAAALGAPV